MKQAIFGYGSLVNKPKLEKFLKHGAAAFNETRLDGWTREWSAVCNNSLPDRYYEQINGAEIPPYVVTLNLIKDSSDIDTMAPNGVLFECDDQDLKIFDSRERHYDRIDVTDYIREKITTTKYIPTPRSHNI